MPSGMRKGKLGFYFAVGGPDSDPSRHPTYMLICANPLTLYTHTHTPQMRPRSDAHVYMTAGGRVQKTLSLPNIVALPLLP